MVNLSTASARKYWANYPDKTIYKIIKHMEEMEEWTHDDEESIEEAMTALEITMDDITGITIQNPSDVINVIAYLKTSRYLNILQTLDTVNPGSASKIIAYAEKNTNEYPANKLFINRNIAFERLRLLSRIFSTDNLTILTKALEGD